MTIRLPPSIVAQLVGAAVAALPNECCGFVAGNHGFAEAVLPIVNEAASPVAFRTEPRSTLAAYRAIRQHQWELLAIYHSHPTGPLCPSVADLQQNTYGEAIPWLIVSPTGAIRAWRLLPQHYVECPLLFLQSESAL